MTLIKPSSDLKNNYNEISNLCHEHNEPVYITENGKNDLVVMSLETYEDLADNSGLQGDGLKNVNQGIMQPTEDIFNGFVP